jgi:hypothetical protein
MSLGGGLRSGGSGGGKLWMFLGGAFLLLVVWTVAVFAFGGGGDGAAKERARQGQTPAHTTPGSTVAGGEKEGPLYSGEGKVVRGGGEEPESITAADPERAIREKRESTVPEGGAHHEPGVYDPLGVDPEPGDLTPRDERRARLAAAKFVAAAYGYSGEDPDEYNQGVGETVVWPGFYDSEGAEEIRRFAGQVRSSGTESAAKLDRFEVQGSEPEEVVGYAYFRTADTYDRYGEIEGDEKSYRQRLKLARQGAVFKVAAAGGVERIEE